MNIDYNAVIEILKSFLENEKTEILGISVGEERQVREAIRHLLTAYEKEKEKNNNVLGLIFEYGQTDGEHHKAWVIDQIVRIITENNYDKWVQHYEYDEETDEDYFWYVGIAP